MSLLGLKDDVIGIFKILAKDEQLAELMEIPSRQMKDIKKQIIEDRFPVDLVQDNLARLCVYENPSYRTVNQDMERNWVVVDIYVNKDKHKIDRRALLIAERVVDILDDSQRKKNGLPVSGVGLGIYYHHKTPNLFSNQAEWFKYGLVFKYDKFLLQN